MGHGRGLDVLILVLTVTLCCAAYCVRNVICQYNNAFAHEPKTQPAVRRPRWEDNLKQACYRNHICHRTNLRRSGYGPVANCCEQGNERSSLGEPLSAFK